MTRDQFHARLLKLIEYAHRDDLCPGCVLQELLDASEAVVDLGSLDAEALEAHGINNVRLVPVPGPGDTHLPPVTRH